MGELIPRSTCSAIAFAAILNSALFSEAYPCPALESVNAANRIRAILGER